MYKLKSIGKIIPPCLTPFVTQKHVYRAYLRKQTREAKRKYYDHIFSLYKNYIKNTWKILNETLNRNRRKHQSQDFFD